jgi:hypothetical protein
MALPCTAKRMFDSVIAGLAPPLFTRGGMQPTARQTDGLVALGSPL